MFYAAPTELDPRDCARSYRHFAPTELTSAKRFPCRTPLAVSLKIVGYPRAEIRRCACSCVNHRQIGISIFQ